MKIYPFSVENPARYFGVDLEKIKHILETVAGDTETRDLVLAIYFLKKSPWIGGTYFRNWMMPEDFVTGRGRWNITKKFPPTNQLPDKYKLIRLLFDLRMNTYPLTQNDRYGWVFKYESFADHLAFLMAHELHHFRRYHLGMHFKEGEQSANKWALNHTYELGFNVSGEKIPRHKKKKYFNNHIFPKVDPYKKFRNLSRGSELLIHYDPHGRYLNEFAEVIRPIRSNSKRIVIKTSDGKSWRWPMEWLTVVS